MTCRSFVLRAMLAAWVMACGGTAQPTAEERTAALGRAVEDLASRNFLKAPGALRELERLARLEDPPDGVLPLLIDAYVFLDRHRDGLAFFDELLETRPDDPEVLRGAAFFRHSYPALDDEATELYRRLVAVAPDDPESYTLFARFLHDREQYERAIAVIEAGLARHPGERDLRNQLGLAYARSGRIEEAEGVLRALAEDHPEYKYAFLNLGYLELGRGRLREAARQFRHVRRLDPRDEEALYNLGRIAIMRGDGDRARYMARLLRAARAR